MHCVHIPEVEVTISLRDQLLSFREATYPVSTSKFGIGTEEGSNKTPLGCFQVSEKYGEGEAYNAIFRGRKRVGLFSSEQQDLEQDIILSRILRLSGIDSDNHNTYQRYIYIHGTNDEEGIGSPKSIGCIRMKNLDVIELYNKVSLGTYVRIKE